MEGFGGSKSSGVGLTENTTAICLLVGSFYEIAMTFLLISFSISIYLIFRRDQKSSRKLFATT